MEETRKNKFELTLTKALLGSFIFLTFIFVLTLKVGGASSWEDKTNLEKKGYCHLKYGEGFRLDKQTQECYKISEEQTKEVYQFSNEEFRNFCTENKFISNKFFSDCWKASK